MKKVSLNGATDAPPVTDKTTLDVFARDLTALLDHLGIDRAVAGGLSMGGQIVMELCRLHSERVAGIVLAATFPQAETAPGRQLRAWTPMPRSCCPRCWRPIRSTTHPR
jgi:3-oxoadipate enol-lactonase